MLSFIRDIRPSQCLTSCLETQTKRHRKEAREASRPRDVKNRRRRSDEAARARPESSGVRENALIPGSEGGAGPLSRKLAGAVEKRTKHRPRCSNGDT